MGILDTLNKLGLNEDAVYLLGIDKVKEFDDLDFALNHDIPYIYNPLFHQGIEKILSADLPDPPVWKGDKPSKKVILTAKQERIAFLKYNYFLSKAKKAKKELFSHNWYKRKKIALLKDMAYWYTLSQKIKEYIMLCNLRLVVQQAGKFAGFYKLDIHELISTGSLALMKSVEGFDILLGNRFSTYAYWAILRMLNRVHADRNKRKNISGQIIEDENGKTIEPVAQDNVNVDCIEMIRQIMDENMANLTDIEKTIIHMRYLHHDKRPSARKISEHLDIAPNLVYRYEKQALAKIRRVIHSKFS